MTSLIEWCKVSEQIPPRYPHACLVFDGEKTRIGYWSKIDHESDSDECSFLLSYGARRRWCQVPDPYWTLLPEPGEER